MRAAKVIVSFGAMAVLFGFASNAVAEPVYLECKFPDAADAPVLKFTLNEEQSTVSLLNTVTKSAQTFRGATFTDTSVEFRDSQTMYMIGRVTLKAARITPILKQINKGECIVLQPPKRAF